MCVELVIAKVRLLRADPLLFAFGKVMVRYDLRLLHEHLAVNILNDDALTARVGNRKMMRRTYRGVHIVILQHGDSLINACRTVKQKPYRSRRGQIGLVGILVSLLFVARHKIRDDQSLLVHTVKRDIYSRKAQNAVGHRAVGRVVLAESEKIKATGRKGLIAFIGFRVHYHSAALFPVIVASEPYRAVFVLCAYGRASEPFGLYAHFGLVKAVRQKNRKVIGDFLVA